MPFDHGKRMPLAQIFKVAIAGLALWFVSVTADHLYMVHGATYPVWLSKAVTIKSTGDSGIEGLTELCGGVGGWSFYDKANGHFLRCTTIVTGSLARPTTYLIENYDQLAEEN
jgi:hypothetical protein